MRTLVYKRTHKHDPDERGCFGIEDCMGEVRKRDFDAVIGVGGIGYEARSNGIDGKVNWIGIGAHKHKAPRGYRGPLVTFDHFILFEEDGPDFRELAPNLAERIYATLGQCSFINFDDDEQAEIDRILRLARREPPSTWTEDDVPVKPKCQPPDYQRR
ncbi:MAG: hypothetical protein AB7O59_21135 [Pirellulales bacterium]